MKKGTIIYLLFCLFSFGFSFSQNYQAPDQLNQLDSCGEKHGYWKEYLDEKFEIVKQKSPARYYWYVRYKHGVRFHEKINNPSFLSNNQTPKKKFKVNKIENSDTLIELNGIYEGFLKNGLTFIYKFKNGLLLNIRTYTVHGWNSETLNYEEKCGNEQFSYSLKFFNKKGDVTFDIYRILQDNGEWYGVHRGECFKSICINGIYFLPASEKEKRPDSLIDFCDSKKEKLLLNYIPLSRDQFCDLDLNYLQIKNRSGEYQYIYRDNDSTKCVEKTQMEIKSTLPLYLNGKLIQERKQKEILGKIELSEIVSIKKKTVFLGEDEIKIITQ